MLDTNHLEGLEVRGRRLSNAPIGVKDSGVQVTLEVAWNSNSCPSGHRFGSPFDAHGQRAREHGADAD
ncbi:MAG: hypothetical protein ABL977_14935, partial [Candidatus Eisenbacteria bacterium]